VVEASKKPASEATPTRLAVELEVGRSRWIGWAVFGLVAGGLLMIGMGTVFQWVGGFLVALGLWNLWLVVRTLRHPPGTIIVDVDGVVLPRGLCVPAPVKVTREQVSAAYFLRRSVPWTRAAPVLVVEVGDAAYTYPRDWFVNEAEQRSVIHALRGETVPAPASAPAATPAPAAS